MDAQTRTQLTNRLTLLNQQLDAANTAYTASLGNSEVESYGFDSGEGKQSVKRRKPAEIRTEITAIEREIAQVTQRLKGTGIVCMNLRR